MGVVLLASERSPFDGAATAAPVPASGPPEGGWGEGVEGTYVRWCSGGRDGPLAIPGLPAGIAP